MQPDLCRLHLEALESRELLAVTGLGFYGPPSYEQYILRQIEEVYIAEQALPIYSSPFLNALHNANAKADAVISPTEQGLHDSQSLIDQARDELFANQGLYIQGEPYISLSFAQKNQMYLDSDDVEEPIEPPADEDTPTWNLEFQVTRYCNDLSATTPEGVNNALHEGHGSVLDFPGSLGDPPSGDYLAVTLPALPNGYMANITLGGSASSSDYYVYIPYIGGSMSVYNGYVHSGNAVTLYIVPVDDRLTEPLETVSLTMGAPYYDFEPETLYSFNIINTSVTATIVDNDDWKIAVSPVVDDSELGYTVLTEEEQTEASFRVERVDAGDGYGEDKHYAIDVALQTSGTTSTSDYRIYLNNSDGSRTLITPSGNGLFTVRIQENSLYSSFTVQAQDDTLTEQLFEKLYISVVSSVGYPLSFISYNVDSTHVEIRIKDNDRITVANILYQGNLDLISDTEETFGTNWKSGSWQASAHWTNGSPTLTLPVAYASSDTFRCKVVLSGQWDSAQTLQVRMKWNYQGETVYSDWTNVPAFNSSVNVTLNETFASIFGQQSAYYDLSSQIDWDFKFASEESREANGDMGTSSNPLYVTYKTPTSNSSNYLSLIHIGCAAASGLGVVTDDTVFQSLWLVFQSKTINKLDYRNGSLTVGDRLYYYGKLTLGQDVTYGYYGVLACLAVTTMQDGTYSVDQFESLARELTLSSYYPHGDGFSVESLLYYADGTCGAWQDFAWNLFGVQGIEVEKRDVAMRSGFSSTSFKVTPTLTGQGNITPRENIWGDHALFVYNNNVYDPSYGVCYGGVSGAISSFVTNLHSVGYITLDSHGDYGKTYHPLHYSTDVDPNLFEWVYYNNN